MALKVVFLAICMLGFGTINTITTKFQDLAVVGHDEAGKPLTFKHPAVQSAFMFFGESLCLLPYFFLEWRYSGTKSRVKRRAELQRRGPAYRARRCLIFAAPAMCDAVATTLLNLGLYYTFASTYQMLRGTLVLFAGCFTRLILRRRLYSHHWLGMALITGGAALVGAASVLSPRHEAPAPAGVGGGMLLGAQRLAAALLRGEGGEGVDAAAEPLFGDLCVVAAQAFTALQFILEEKLVASYRVPTLLAVGLEGAWGCALCAAALPLLGALRLGPGGQPLDSAAAALREIATHGPLATSVAVSIASIGAFNFFGISVTKALSGAGRATIDATRTLFVWLVSLGLGWERFLPLQVVGFAVLFAGTSLYNELIRVCLPAREEVEEEEEESSSGSVSESGYESGEGSSDGEEDEEGGGGAGARAGRQRRKGRAAGGGGSDSAGLAAPLLAKDASSSGGGGAGGFAFGAGGMAQQRGASLGLPGSVPVAVAGAAAGAEEAGGGAAGVGGAAGQLAHHHVHAHHAHPHPHKAPRRRDSSEGEYTMARSMRLGQSTLQPHALDADTDDASEGLGGGSPGWYGSGTTGGLLSQPNIPEGDEESDAMVGPMSGVDMAGPGSGRGEEEESEGGRGGRRPVRVVMGPGGMLSREREREREAGGRGGGAAGAGGRR